MSTFRLESAVAFNEMLVDERVRLEGYVDHLKTDIIKKKSRPQHGFAHAAREVMGSTKRKLWEEVKDSLQDAAMHNAWTSAKSQEDTNRLPESYIVRIDAERNDRLLQRKYKKTEHGFALAEEVRNLLDDIKLLKHV